MIAFLGLFALVGFCAFVSRQEMDSGARTEHIENTAAALASTRAALLESLPLRIAELDKAVGASDWEMAKRLWEEIHALPLNEDFKAQLEERRPPIEQGLLQARKEELARKSLAWSSNAKAVAADPKLCGQAERLSVLLDEMEAIENVLVENEPRDELTGTLARLEKCRKSVVGKLTKLGRKEGVLARVALANVIESSFLQNRNDVDVRVTGTDKTTLRMRWIWNRVSIGDFEEEETLAMIRAAGFQKIHYDSFTVYYTTTLDGTDWGRKKVQEARLDRPFAMAASSTSR